MLFIVAFFTALITKLWDWGARKLTARRGDPAYRSSLAGSMP